MSGNETTIKRVRLATAVLQTPHLSGGLIAIIVEKGAPNNGMVEP